MILPLPGEPTSGDSSGQKEGSALYAQHGTILMGSLPEPAAGMSSGLLNHITIGLLSLPSPVPASFLLDVLIIDKNILSQTLISVSAPREPSLPISWSHEFSQFHENCCFFISHDSASLSVDSL